MAAQLEEILQESRSRSARFQSSGVPVRIICKFGLVSPELITVHRGDDDIQRASNCDIAA